MLRRVRAGMNLVVGTGGREIVEGVVVVGGGVSGCVCAAIMGSLGMAVTLVDPALDRLGEPRYGPVVVPDGASGPAVGDWVQALPEELRQVWEEGAMTAEHGSVVVVDRRLVGVRTKQVLERMKGLQIRQGLVVGVRRAEGDDGADREERSALEVETAFGETFVSRAVVVAVGMGLRGSGGAERDDRGGYGRPAGRGLEESLEAMGAEFAESRAEVGPRFVASDQGEGVSRSERGWASWCEERMGGSPEVRMVGLSRGDEETASWGEDAAPSPYDTEELWLKEALVEEENGAGIRVIGAPDGVAMAEVAVDTLGEDIGATRKIGKPCWVGGERRASRPGYVVRGLAVTNLDGVGRLKGARGGGLPIWVVGRAGGASRYVESMQAATRTGRAIAEYLKLGTGTTR